MTTTDPMHTRKVGDLVSLDHPDWPGVWKIESFGPKRAVVLPQNGGRGLRAPREWLIDPVGDTSQLVPYVHYPLGAIVRLKGPRFEGLWVVLVDKGEKVNVAKLGGNEDRYVKAPKTWLTLVDPAEVLK